MEERDIAAMFASRDENAIQETEKKYGAELLNCAKRITGSWEDAKECLNDALLSAWRGTEEYRPEKLRAYLMKIIRNTALDRLRKKEASKRNAVSVALDELAECLPDEKAYSKLLNDEGLVHEIEEWLLTVGKEKRAVFIRRYFKNETPAEIAKCLGMKAGTVNVTLLRLRSSLKVYLESKDYVI